MMSKRAEVTTLADCSGGEVVEIAGLEYVIGSSRCVDGYLARRCRQVAGRWVSFGGVVHFDLSADARLLAGQERFAAAGADDSEMDPLKRRS